jgi:hypothetical protein
VVSGISRSIPAPTRALPVCNCLGVHPGGVPFVAVRCTVSEPMMKSRASTWIQGARRPPRVLSRLTRIRIAAAAPPHQ